MIECFFDGAVQPRNPGGHGGYGMLIRQNYQTIYSEAVYIGRWPALSNNVAEYAGVIAALRYLLKHGITEAIIRGDASMIVGQLNSSMRAKHGAYVPYYEEAYALRAQLPKVKIEWIPREMNQAADDLSKIGCGKRVIGFSLDPNVTVIAQPVIKRRKRIRRRERPVPVAIETDSEMLEYFWSNYRTP